MTILAGRRKWQRAGWLKRHSLSLVLLALMLAQTAAYFGLLWPLWTEEQTAHGQPAPFGSFQRSFWAEMMVSILADTYGALLLVLFSKWFFERGSVESRDPDEGSDSS